MEEKKDQPTLGKGRKEREEKGRGRGTRGRKDWTRLVCAVSRVNNSNNTLSIKGILEVLLLTYQEEIKDMFAVDYHAIKQRILVIRTITIQ